MLDQVRIVLQLKAGDVTRQVEAMGKAGRCRTCKAEVVFVTMPNGKTPPFNPDGVTHFATCPQADTWRGRTGAKS